jgi:hypothetical protein
VLRYIKIRDFFILNGKESDLMKVNIDGKEIELNPRDESYMQGYKNGNINGLKHGLNQINVIRDMMIKLIEQVENME